MCGVRLEARVHIVTAAAAAAQNIIKCCTRCDLEVLDIVLEPLASGEAVLEEDEKGLGVALVDIGGGTTDIAIFTDGAVAHTSVIPIGGHQLTSDIAFGLRTPPHEAEKIKIRSGCALSGMVAEDETLEVASVGGRAPRVLSRHTLCRDIIQPRIEEVFSFVKAEIIRLGCEDMLASGAVITGGTTQLAGMTELGEEILGIPVRRGAPKGVGGLAEVVRNAAFSTAVGLVQYGISRQAGDRPSGDVPKRSSGLFSRLRRSLSNAF
jgi:cell division protein FtsA